VARLEIYWRAARSPRKDASFVLELLDAQGHVCASRTIQPAGAYGTSQWHRGEVVRGQVRFRLPVDTPAGEYTLALRGPRQNRRVKLNTLTVGSPDGRRSFEIPSMQHTVNANLGDRVELLGYTVEQETVRAGEAVSCTLYWRALQAMNYEYTVFNHLIAPDGQTWGQWDNQPQRGASPTTRWVPGQVIADPYQIPVSADAPAGALDLYVGMYDLQTMVRLPVLDIDGEIAGDRIRLSTVKVTTR
jgi:hypothetical protein